MSFSLEVIVLLLGICTLRDFCGVWGLVWTDFKVAHKEKERFESPPTLSPLLLLFRQPPLTEFWGCQCYEHLLQNNVNLARSPPFGEVVCQLWNWLLNK
jgi:hypothetical protein